MSENRKWYVVHTHPGYEKKLSEILNRRRIEGYCPFNTLTRPGNENRKPLLEPLFSSYVFARTYEHKADELKKINGVINLVHWLGRPAVVNHPEILALKKFLGEHLRVRLEKTEVNVDGEVTICEDSYTATGKYRPISKNKHLKLLLPSMGYLIVAELKTANFELQSQAG